MKQYSEKRSEPRVYYWTPITIQESDVYFLYRARLANQSGGGLYFETDLFLSHGAKVFIGIQDSNHRFFQKDHDNILAEIIWRKPLAKISFNYGYGARVLFGESERKSQANNHAELLRLRKNPRRPFSRLAYFACGNKYYEGIIKNLSRGGAFIDTKTKFSNGDEIKLVVPGPNKYIQIKAKIIHLKQTGFGVKFISVLKIVNLHEAKNSSRIMPM